MNQSANRFAIGAHLKAARMGYTHHGIYLGEGKVIHYAGFCEAFKSAPVEITTLAEFQGKAKRIEVVTYNPADCLSAHEIIDRAKSRLHEDDYSLFFNNCEHFACWCVTGRSVSRQVKVALSAITGVLGFLALHSLRPHQSVILAEGGRVEF